MDWHNDRLYVTMKDPTRLVAIDSNTGKLDQEMDLKGQIRYLNSAVFSEPNTLFMAGYHLDDCGWIKGSLFEYNLDTNDMIHHQ